MAVRNEYTLEDVKKFATEAEIKRACAQLLTMYQEKGRLIYQRNNSFFGGFERSNGSRGFIRNNTPGAPDFYIFMRGGKTIHLELKRGKGKQSEEQKTWQKNCELLGHIYAVIRGVDELQKIIDIYD